MTKVAHFDGDVLFFEKHDEKYMLKIDGSERKLLSSSAAPVAKLKLFFPKRKFECLGFFNSWIVVWLLVLFSRSLVRKVDIKYRRIRIVRNFPVRVEDRSDFDRKIGTGNLNKSKKFIFEELDIKSVKF